MIFFPPPRPQNVKRPLASGRGESFIYLTKWVSSELIPAPGTVKVLWAPSPELDEKYLVALDQV